MKALTDDDALTLAAPVGAHFRPSPLARSLRVGPTKQTRGDVARNAKRAAIVLRRGMRQIEFRHVEKRLNRNNLTTLPVVIGKRPSTMPETVCGLIVTGASVVSHPDERACLTAIVREAVELDVPILAMSDAAPLVLAASGFALSGDEAHVGVLIDRQVTTLADRGQIDLAIDSMAQGVGR